MPSIDAKDYEVVNSLKGRIIKEAYLKKDGSELILTFIYGDYAIHKLSNL